MSQSENQDEEDSGFARSVPVACPLCGGISCTSLFRKEGIPYYACAVCTFRFSLPELNANFANTFDDFETSYLQYFQDGAGDDVNFAKVAAWISGFSPLDATTLLDVGSGSGKWVRYLRRHGTDAHGVEPSRALYSHFLAKDEHFYHGSLAAYSVTVRRKFRVVTAFDVIEHVADPTETLSLIAGFLEPGGHAFISTPDAGSPHARAMGKHWHYNNKYHLSYWSQRTLEATAAKFGLTLRYFGRRSRYQTLGYVASYFWERILRRRAPEAFKSADRVALPVNLFDVMYVCFEKTGVEGRPE